jgi:hypothetical protein
MSAYQGAIPSSVAQNKTLLHKNLYFRLKIFLPKAQPAEASSQ